MRVNWTPDDCTALNIWLNTDLGQKFLRALESGRPNFEVAMDLNSMAMTGAVCKGFDQALDKIDKMRQVKGSTPLDIKYVDTHTD
jgi:hypothetical protein